jgi:hypothetical protein
MICYGDDGNITEGFYEYHESGLLKEGVIRSKEGKIIETINEFEEFINVYKNLIVLKIGTEKLE